jgi:hypothetical protein
LKTRVSVALLFVAATSVATPAAAVPKITTPLAGLKDLLAHALGAPGTDDVMDTATWSTATSNAGAAVLGLRELFKAGAPKATKALIDGITGREYFTAKNDPAAAEISKFVETLRSSFPTPTGAALRVLVRGNGPAGLASALYARKGGATVVDVVAERMTYTRQHVVTLQYALDENKPDIEIKGMTRLLKLTGFIGTSGNAASAGVAKAIRSIVPASATSTTDEVTDERADVHMQISSLELWLHLCAAIVGINVQQATLVPRPTYATAPVVTTPAPTRKAVRSEVVRLSNTATELPAAACDTEGKEEFTTTELDSMKSTTNYDILIGADGANSITRKALFGTRSASTTVGKTMVEDQFFAMSCPKSKTETTVLSDDSLFFRSAGAAGKKSPSTRGIDVERAKTLYGTPPHAGLVVAAFVVRGTAGEDPCAFFASTGTTARGVLMTYSKSFTPNNYQSSAHLPYCAVEITLRYDAGYLFEQIMPPGCSFNYNVVTPGSDGKDIDRKTKTMVLLAQFLREQTKKTHRVADVLDAVTEFKFWDNRLRVSGSKTRPDDLTKYAIRATENLTETVPGRTRGARASTRTVLAMLVGDAVRDANPDGGMGANDAHHGATVVEEIVKDRIGGADYSDKIKAFLKHEAKVACGLQALVKTKLLSAELERSGPIGLMTPNLRHSETKKRLKAGVAAGATPSAEDYEIYSSPHVESVAVPEKKKEK